MGTSLKVLHIEDDPLDARLLKDMLSGESPEQVQLTQVEYLSDAKRALDDRHYDVALLDLMLPDEKGTPSILSLRASAPELPIVVYTSMPSLNLAREAIRAGAEDYAVKGHTDAFTLVRKLYTAIERHQLKLDLYGQLADLSSENQELQELSYQDSLTGLYNRRGLERRLEQYLQGDVQDAYATLIDVDDFKHINDHYGHHVGDQVLQEVAQALVLCGQGRRVLARIGGDEFLVIGTGGRAAAEEQGRCLRQSLRDNRVVSHLTDGYQVTCCQAITLIGRRRSNLAELLEATHAALSHGKIAGKDRVVGQWDLEEGAPDKAA